MSNIILFIPIRVVFFCAFFTECIFIIFFFNIWWFFNGWCKILGWNLLISNGNGISNITINFSLLLSHLVIALSTVALNLFAYFSIWSVHGFMAYVCIYCFKYVYYHSKYFQKKILCNGMLWVIFLMQNKLNSLKSLILGKSLWLNKVINFYTRKL